MYSYLKEIKKNWKPEPKEFTHRDSTVTLYRDVQSMDYTTERLAFKSYVFKEISPLVDEIFNEIE